MNKLKNLCIVGLALLLFLTGCTASFYQKGKQHLQQEEYDSAISYFIKSLKENLRDWKSVREMGIAYYKKKNIKMAEKLLTKAIKINPDDARTLLYLGMSYEAEDKISDAIQVYRQYSAISPLRKIRRTIEGRLEQLINKQMKMEARQALANEAALSVNSVKENSVAVLFFQNLGNKRGLDPLQKGIADMLITDLSKVKKISVVERVKLHYLMEELKLSQTGLTNASTMPRIGKLLGVSTIVKGTFVDLKNYQFRMDAGLISTKGKSKMVSDNVNGNFKYLFKLEKDLVFKLIQRMGIQLTQEERDAIEIIPTENILAFMAYSRGLDYEDRGQFERASQSFQKAVNLDPNFNLAGNRLKRSQAAGAGKTPLSNLEKLAAGSQERPPQRQRYLQHLSRVHHQSFIPGIDSRKPVEEQSDTSFGNAADIQIQIIWH